jgi:hypothetical protein
MLPLILAVFVACFVLERVVPGWRLPRVETWPFRVIAINVVQLGVVLLAGLSWERWLSSRSIFQLSAHVHPLLGGFIAYFIATFVFYWWHRWRHEADLLWLGFHQIHHSPQRIEVITSFYKHPLEMTVNSILGSLIVYTCLGLDLKAGAIYTAFTALGEFFYHTNVRTPRWAGYIFQRPECTASTTSTAATRTTTATLSGGTCSSARTRIRRRSRHRAVSTTRASSGSWRCWRSTMCTRRRVRRLTTRPRNGRTRTGADRLI